ncbi:TPA: peptidase, partial [Neisseria meningitidis]
LVLIFVNPLHMELETVVPPEEGEGEGEGADGEMPEYLELHGGREDDISAPSQPEPPTRNIKPLVFGLLIAFLGYLLGKIF